MISKATIVTLLRDSADTLLNRQRFVHDWLHSGAFGTFEHCTELGCCEVAALRKRQFRAADDLEKTGVGPS